jgi:hypothetical protein
VSGGRSAPGLPAFNPNRVVRQRQRHFFPLFLPLHYTCRFMVVRASRSSSLFPPLAELAGSCHLESPAFTRTVRVIANMLTETERVISSESGIIVERESILVNPAGEVHAKLYVCVHANSQSGLISCLDSLRRLIWARKLQVPSSQRSSRVLPPQRPSRRTGLRTML